MSTVEEPNYEDPLERAFWMNAEIEGLEREMIATGKSLSQVAEARVPFFQNGWGIDTSALEDIIPDLEEAIRTGRGLELQRQRLAEELINISKTIKEKK